MRMFHNEKDQKVKAQNTVFMINVTIHLLIVQLYKYLVEK